MAVIEIMSLLLSKLENSIVYGTLRAMGYALRFARVRIVTIRSVSMDMKMVIR